MTVKLKELRITHSIREHPRGVKSGSRESISLLRVQAGPLFGDQVRHPLPE